MFNNDFYPTPREVIIKMIQTFRLDGAHILEPSAGKGDLIDYLDENFSLSSVMVCEKEDKLRRILDEKYRVLSSDFLEVKSSEVSHIDFIFMNPPFSADHKHVLHAWEVCPEGCTVVALINSQTLENTYTRTRRELDQLIKKYGYIEKLGKCFKGSERSTDVSVTMVTLIKPKTKGEDEFLGYFDLHEEYQHLTEGGVVKYNFVVDLINRYKGAVNMFDEVQEAADRINALTNDFDTKHRIKFSASGGDDNREITREVFKKETQKAAWKTVFKRMNLGKYLTNSAMEKINEFVEKQTHIPFTLNNVYRMIEFIMGTHEDRVNKIIVDAFDRITRHHKGNRMNKQEWKTNSQYRVNKKFILPSVVKWCPYGEHIEPNYYNSEVMDDIHKALCYITGGNFTEAGTFSNFLYNKVPAPRYDGDTYTTKTLYREIGVWHDWGFFEVKFFKAGTAHFKFKNTEVWDLFNKLACKCKGFHLAENYTADFRRKSTGVQKF